MLLTCKDFIYDNFRLSDYDYISVNFENETTLPSAINRNMEVSNMNRFRKETIGFGITYEDTLEFDIHIIKNFCNCTSQRFSANEYENLVSNLTSMEKYSLLTITKKDGSTVICRGYFSSVTPFDVVGVCYGAYCTFKCDSPFTYSIKSETKNLLGVTNFHLNNESSERYSYVYPTLLVKPTANEEIFIHNISDSDLIISDVLENPSSISLADKIDEYGKLYGYTVTYIYENSYVQTHCDDTVILFYYTDSYGVKNKYIAYYLDDGKYYIYKGGFFYCRLYKDLNITMDCKNLGLYDSLKRPVLFEKVGIQDEDEIYWLRLLYGDNRLLVKGNVEIEFCWYEPRKGELV